MPRELAVAVENSFVKGLVTEATGLNFPENACTETYDCIFNKKGNVYRRLGFAPEDNFDSFETDFSGKAVTEYLWEAVSKNGSVTIFVLQIGATISFFGVNSESALSPTVKSFSVTLTNYSIPGTTTEQIIENHCQFDSGYGMLFITHPFCDPIQVEYDSDTDDITETRIIIKIRDVDGIPNKMTDGTVPAHNHRPSNSEVTQSIMYNLYNQGWAVKTAVTGTGQHWDPSSHPILLWRGGDGTFGYLWINPFGYRRNDWPAEGDVWFRMKGTILPFQDGDGNVHPPIPPGEGFSFLGIDKAGQAMAPAAKGHFLLDAFAENRTLAVAVHNPTVPFPLSNFSANYNPTMHDKNAGIHRPGSVAFHTGRAFYTGISHEDYAGEVYFSQILDQNLHADRCYSHNDPTSEEAPDLLPNDGGVIRIAEMAKPTKLYSLGNNLLVFATNGVWRIGGSLGETAGGFAANDYTVTRLSEIGSISSLSFVKTDNAILWWNHDGIWALSLGNTQGIQIQSISENTIKEFIDNLPSTEFRYVKGAYNPVSKIVQWLYRDTPSESVTERYRYSHILNLDTNTGAFYPWTIPDACPYVVGITCIKGVGEEVISEDVVDNDGATVTANDGTDVTINIVERTDLTSRFKYVVDNECAALEVPDGEAADIFTVNTELIGVHDGTGYTVTYTPGQNSIILGEDNKIYTFANTAAGFPVQQIMQHDGGVGTTKTYALATVLSEAATATGKTWATTSPMMSVLAVPYTQYFYFLTAAREGASTYWGIISLYKIDGTGTIVHQATKIYTGGFSVVPFTAFYPVYGVGFIGAADADPLDKTLVAAVASRTSIVSGSSHSAVLQLPPVNTFIASSGSAGAWADLLTSITESWNIFAWEASEQPDEGTNNCFLLPVSSTETRLCIYVSKAKCDWLNDPANSGSAFRNATLASFAATYTNGFVIGKNVLTGGSWTIMNSSFDVPFTDLGLNVDSSVGDSYYNDWQNPSVQTNASDGVTYITWTRRFEPSSTNFPVSGSWTLARVFVWNQDTQVTTLFEEVSGSGYNVVDDLGAPAGNRYDSYPVTAYSFFHPQFSAIYSFASHDATHGGQGLKFVMFKIADVTLPVLVETPASLFFAETTNTNYLDWEDITEGEDYTSYFVTGYKLRGEGSRKWQSNYLTLYNDTTNDSTFDIFSKWDYANTGDTGRWSSTQRVAMTNQDYDYGIKRLKIRGHGKAMQYKVSSVTSEPFDIIGWSSWDSTNAKP